LREGEKYKKENTKMNRRKVFEKCGKTKLLRIRGKGGGERLFLIFFFFF
jgi:hypothetical protein